MPTSARHPDRWRFRCTTLAIATDCAPVRSPLASAGWDVAMTTVYEYWQHRATGDVWAVMLRDGKVVGATEIRRDNVHDELLPHLS
jgi:hypothetical protein